MIEPTDTVIFTKEEKGIWTTGDGRLFVSDGSQTLVFPIPAAQLYRDIYIRKLLHKEAMGKRK